MEKRTEHYEMTLLGRTPPIQAHAVVDVREWTEGGLRHRACSIVLTWADRSLRADSDSVYHAFQAMRELLEPEGLTPDAYGSCPDVRPSGMQLDMGDGTYAYRHAASGPGESPPVVNIFATEPGLKFGTVAEQRDYFPQRAESPPDEGLVARVGRWLGHAFEKNPAGKPLAERREPDQPAVKPSRKLRPPLRRIMAMFGQGTSEDRSEAVEHVLRAALQEIQVLKALMREKGVWDDDAYRRLRREAMILDHNTAGPFPHTFHSYYPFTLDEDELLSFACKATKEDVALYHEEVRKVQHLT